MNHDDDAPLPPMSQAILDEAQLDALFADIAQLAHIDEIIIKSGPGRVNDDQRHSLDEARQLLRSGQARGVQIRYRHNHAHWWDALMQTPQGTQLTRIRHDFERPA
ncbi:MAG: hypothetical protein ACTS3F_05625 [Phycisphaerales bacterium]